MAYEWVGGFPVQTDWAVFEWVGGLPAVVYSLPPEQIIFPVGVAGAETFGSSKFVMYLLPSGIASLEEVGTSKLNFRLIAWGIETAENFGMTALTKGLPSIMIGGRRAKEAESREPKKSLPRRAHDA